MGDQLMIDMKSLRSDMFELQTENFSAIEAIKEEQTSLENKLHSEAEALRKEQLSAIYNVMDAIEADHVKTAEDFENLRALCAKSSGGLKLQQRDQDCAVEVLRKQQNDMFSMHDSGESGLHGW